MAADTADGRPLIPYIGYGPTNAAGVAQTAYGSGAIAGVETRPAWRSRRPIPSLAPAHPTRCPSTLLLEFRFTEKSGPELVEFNVWGDFGAVVLQPKGVILITSTVAAGDAGGTSADGEASGSGSGRNCLKLRPGR